MHYIPDRGRTSSLRSRRNKEADKVHIEVAMGRCRIGPEAAREIARKIERQHGFWDYQERRSAT